MVNGRNRGGRGGHLGRGAVGGGPNPPAKIAGLGAGNAQVNGNQLTLTAGCTVEFADGESARIYMSSGIYSLAKNTVYRLPARTWFVLDASATLKGATDQSIQIGTMNFGTFSLPRGSIVTCDTEVRPGVPITQAVTIRQAVTIPSPLTVSPTQSMHLPGAMRLPRAGIFCRAAVDIVDATTIHLLGHFLNPVLGLTLTAGMNLNAAMRLGGPMTVNRMRPGGSMYVLDVITTQGQDGQPTIDNGAGSTILTTQVIMNDNPLPCGTLVPADTTVPSGTIIPCNTDIPSGTNIPAGTILPAGTTLPAGMIVPTGSILPFNTGI